uniref:Clusterin n=1 Tax=Fundulus heteroclitus TaxID=8078 RepID=A0A3Q2PDU5_FUNHE
ELSAAGERYVNEGMNKCLTRVKQVKEKMEKEEEKHKNLMEALRHSGDKKRVETEQKLEEAERQCRDLTKSFFVECRPCLEDSCKAFFTSTCRRGYASFTFKNSDQSFSLLQAEASFAQMLSNISDLYDDSMALAKRMHHVLGPSFFELQPSSLSAPQDGSGFFKSLGLDHMFHSAIAFGRDVMEEFTDEYFHHSNRGIRLLLLGYLCRALRRQASECWQLQSLCETCRNNLITECPHLQQLHSEMEEMHTLLNASRLQYDNRLHFVHRHTADTLRWFSDTRDECGWLNWMADVSGLQDNIFRVIKVCLQKNVEATHCALSINMTHTGADSSVVVSILDLAPLTVLVPADLMVEDPAFVQYIAQEALTQYKQQIKEDA